MTDPFEELIHQLSLVLDVEIHLDHNNAVALKIRDKMVVQIQENRERKQILIVSLISEIPPGRFRENIFGEALKANSSLDQRPGTLSYLAMKNFLTLHQAHPLEELDGKKLAALTSAFIEFAEQWQRAIEKGQIGPL